MAQYDAAWWDAQYNNRARVPEHGVLLARWAEASALARKRMVCLVDEAYGDAPGERLDVFPAQGAGAPVLVFIHGGWWRALDKAEHSFIAPAFVQAGAMVVVPNYTLAPAASIDTIALQMVQALAWTWRHAQRFGGNPSRVVVAGHSAGGHLAAMLLACHWKAVAADLPVRLVHGALSLSGVFDLAPIRRTPFLQADLRLTPASVRRLSPARFSPPRGPLHAVVGADESAEHVRQNQLIRDRWGARAVPVCEALPGLNHFTVLHDLVDATGRSHAHARRLLGLVGPESRRPGESPIGNNP